MNRLAWRKAQTLALCIVAVCLSRFSYIHWRTTQEDSRLVSSVEQQLLALVKEAEGLDLQQKRQLELLVRTEKSPSIELFSSEYWLSELQQIANSERAVNRFSARIVIDDIAALNRRDGIEIINVPVEFELSTPDLVLAVRMIEELSQVLGSYKTVESCRVQNRAGLGGEAAYRMQCRITKTAYTVVPL